MRMWWIAFKRANDGTDFSLGDWNEVDQRPTSRNMSPFYSTSCYFFELHNIIAMNHQEANWLTSIYKIHNCTLRVDFNINGWYHSGSQIHTLNIGTKRQVYDVSRFAMWGRPRTVANTCVYKPLAGKNTRFNNKHTIASTHFAVQIIHQCYIFHFNFSDCTFWMAFLQYWMVGCHQFSQYM